MGDYADDYIDSCFDEHMRYDPDSQLPQDNLGLIGIPYESIIRKTNRAILIQLDVEIAPFRMEKVKTEPMWLPLKFCIVNEIAKKVHIPQWLQERKIAEQCQIAAEKIHKNI